MLITIGDWYYTVVIFYTHCSKKHSKSERKCKKIQASLIAKIKYFAVKKPPKINTVSANVDEAVLGWRKDLTGHHQSPITQLIAL